MTRPESTAITIAILLLALLGMYLGWRARKRRQSAIAPLPVVPTNLGAALFTVEALYVATTLAGEPLNRVAVRGLGFRGRATVTVVPEGVVLGIAGIAEVWVAREAIRSVERATWTIDKAVEAGGLAVIAWAIGETQVDTYLRITEPADPMPLIDAISGILPTKAAK